VARSLSRLFLPLTVALAACAGDPAAVVDPPPAPPGARVVSVTIRPDTVTLAPGAGLYLAATLRDSTGAVVGGRNVSWVADTTVARISPQGYARAVGLGTTVVQAFVDSASARGALTVRVPVASVTVLPDTARLVLGQKLLLVALPMDSAGNLLNDRVVTWTNSNPQIVQLFQGSALRALAIGRAVLTATVEHRSASSLVVVRDSAGGP